MTTVLDVTCGLGWTVAYILSILHGIRHKTWCIPALSICMNFSWEVCAVMERIGNGSTGGIPFAMQLSWMLFDIGIIATWLCYGYKGRQFLMKGLALFTAVFAAVYLVARVWGQWEFSVFLINVIMSAEFLFRLSKDGSAWTSRPVAAAKLVGTLAATLLNGLIYPNRMVLWLGGICLLLDSYYLYRLFSNQKE